MNGLTEKLEIITESLKFILPEVSIVFAILLIIIADLVTKNKTTISVIAFGSILVILYFDLLQLNFSTDKVHQLFLNSLHLDQVSVFWKLIIDFGLLMTLVINSRFTMAKYRSEFIMMFFFMLLGAHMLMMSSNLLMVYLSVELMSIGAYILTTYGFKNKNYEAAIKYLLFGAVSSAVMIYGMSLIYAMTGSLQFTSAQFTDALLNADSIPMLVAGFMVLAGLLFKISAVPMHIWTPDVYQVTPIPAVSFFSVVPKLAGLAILIKWLLVINLFGIGEIEFEKILGAIAVITLIVGNFSALWQSNVKRMMAYSAIAHTGFLLMAAVAFSEIGLKSILFYSVIYVLMNTGVFLLINFFEQNNNAKEFKDYKGLSRPYPVLTFFIVILMIALTGLPPTAGFTAKLFVFTAVWDAYSVSGDSWLLFIFIFGLLNAIISLFYYLKLPYYMIFKESKNSEKKGLPITENFLGGIIVLAILILFFKPEWLMNIINNLNFAF